MSFITTQHSHPLCWWRGVFQRFEQDDLQRLQIWKNKWPTLFSLPTAHLLQHAVCLLLHARLLGLKTDIALPKNIWIQILMVFFFLPLNMAWSARRFWSGKPRLQRESWRSPGPSWQAWEKTCQYLQQILWRKISIITFYRVTSVVSVLLSLSMAFCRNVHTIWRKVSFTLERNQDV